MIPVVDETTPYDDDNSDHHFIIKGHHAFNIRCYLLFFIRVSIVRLPWKDGMIGGDSP